jgi:hypothetical protein
MRWLVHGQLPGAVAEALRRHGHTTELVEPEPASLEELVQVARKLQLDVITSDAALIAAAARSHPKFARSIVFLQLAGDEAGMSGAVDRLFARYPRLTPGRLYTVTGSRVKIRQLPGSATAAHR